MIRNELLVNEYSIVIIIFFVINSLRLLFRVLSCESAVKNVNEKMWAAVS